ncbi:MAG: hypothetical protein WC775_00425 [Patescibacteria group bacterium]|jgi:hypothetical protein
MTTKQSSDLAKQEQVNLNVNLDTTPIMYTDSILMSTNQFGVVLDVCQRLGTTNQVRIVSRLGMSREHAMKFIEELGKLLVMTEGQAKTGKN